MAVEVKAGTVEFIIAVDLLALAKSRDGFISYRHGNEWLSRVSENLTLVPSSTFDGPARSKAQYAFTEERATGPTLSSFEAHGLMPVELAYKSPIEYSDVSSLTVQTKRFRIGSSGALSWTTTVTVEGRLSAQNYIDKMWSQFQIIQSRFPQELQAFIQHWNKGHGSSAGLQAPENLSPWLRRYEIHVLDIDAASVEEFNPARLKEIYSSPELSPVLGDLAAISRLSHVKPDLYDESRLADLRNHDLANRRDELWLVNSARIIQIHPDMQSRLVKSFFADVGLAIELLVQQKASLAFMEHWLDGVRSRASTAKSKTYGRDLLDGHRALDKYVEPLYMLSASANPNFEHAVERIAEEIGVIRQSERAIRSLALMVAVSNTLASFGASRNDRKISIWLGVLTAVVTLLTAVQAIVVLLQFLRSPLIP